MTRPCPTCHSHTTTPMERPRQIVPWYRCDACLDVFFFSQALAGRTVATAPVKFVSPAPAAPSGDSDRRGVTRG